MDNTEVEQRWVMCNDCCTWRRMVEGNHHPWCGCGSDNFRWEDERDYNPEDPNTWPQQDTSENVELLPCPHCASKSIEVLKPANRRGYVMCFGCGAVAQSVEDWNRRIVPEVPFEPLTSIRIGETHDWRYNAYVRQDAWSLHVLNGAHPEVPVRYADEFEAEHFNACKELVEVERRKVAQLTAIKEANEQNKV